MVDSSEVDKTQAEQPVEENSIQHNDDDDLLDKDPDEVENGDKEIDATEVARQLNSSTAEASPTNYNSAPPPGSDVPASEVASEKPQEKVDEDGNTIPNKVFAGGISWSTTEDGLRSYFSRYGEVITVDLMRNRTDNQPRGFAFITFKDAASVQAATTKQMHEIDGKNVEVKHAYKKQDDRDPGAMPSKLFVGGITPDTRENDLQEYFSKFGKLSAVVVMLDHQTQRGRGFGFITYERKEDAEKVLRMDEHSVLGKHVDVKTYKPKPSGDNRRGMYGHGGGGGHGMGMGYGGHMGRGGYGGGYGGGGPMYGGGHGYGGGQHMYGGYGGYGGMYGGGGYGHGPPHGGYGSGGGGGYGQQRYGGGGGGYGGHGSHGGQSGHGGQGNQSESQGGGSGGGYGSQRQQQRDARYKPY